MPRKHTNQKFVTPAASVAAKAEYVRDEARKGAGGHHCHWPGCEKPVPPAMWGCKRHWFMLPATLRAKVWRTYRPGQEVTTRTASGSSNRIVM